MIDFTLGVLNVASFGCTWKGSQYSRSKDLFSSFQLTIIFHQKTMNTTLTHWGLNEIARDPPLIPWHFLEYFRASKSTKINLMGSKHRHKIRFQDVVYSKSNKWRAKILKNINKKTLTRCVKLIRKQEIIFISLPCDKMSNKSRENWIWKKELTFDFRGQNKTKYNRISFLVLFGLTFEKTTENKSEELIKKSIWKQEIK